MNGHFYEWNRAVRNLHTEAGVKVEVYCHRDVQPDIRDELCAVPHFHDTFAEAIPSRSKIFRLCGFLVHSHRAYRQAREALVRCGPVDTVLLSTAPDHQLLAWSQICAESLGSRFQRLVLFFIVGQARYEDYNPQPRFLRRARLIRSVLRRFGPAVSDGRVMLCSDSDQTAKEYSLLSGLPFVELPSPRVISSILKRDVGNPVTIATLGPPREEKGSRTLLEAIDILRGMTLAHPVRFFVQWPCDFDDEHGRRVVIPSDWKDDPRIVVIRKFYDSGEYVKAMMECDCIVLPYRWREYYSRISAVLVEAASAGIPTVVVENTWLHRAMQKYGAGLACQDCSPQDLARAVAQACTEIKELTALARARAVVAQAHHSPERFRRLLWGIPE